MRLMTAACLAVAGLVISGCSTRAPHAANAPITGIWTMHVDYRNSASTNGQLTLAVSQNGVVTGIAHGLTPRGDWHISLSSERPQPRDPRFVVLGDGVLLRHDLASKCIPTAKIKTILTYVYAEGEPSGILCLRSGGYTLEGQGFVFGEDVARLSASRPINPTLAFLEASSFETSNIVGALIYTIFGGAFAILLASFIVLTAAHLLKVKSVRKFVSSFEVTEEAVNGEDLSAVEVFCQVVRFGNDLYFEKMASPLEKRHGKLLNKLVKASVTAPSPNSPWIISFTLPVHIRLGTQFVLFVHADEATIGRLAQTSFFDHHQCHAADRHLYFRLSKEDRPYFHSVKTVEGIENMMFFPSDLPGFTRGNRYCRWR